MKIDENFELMKKIIKTEADADARLKALEKLSQKKVVMEDDAGFVGEYVKWTDVLKVLV